MGLASSTISSHISAVAFVHKINSWPDPSNNFLIQKLREGCRRQRRTPDIRRPITLDLLGDLCRILGSIAASELECRLFRSLFTLAYFGFFRVGEITASSKSADCSRIVGINDVVFEGGDQSVLLVQLRFSKTDQRGDAVTLRFQCTPELPLCPVRSILGYLEVRPARSGPLFIHANGSPVTAFQFRHMLKTSLEA